MKTLIPIVSMIIFLSACKSHEHMDKTDLVYAPREEVTITTASNKTLKVDFSQDEQMKGCINSEIGQNKIDPIKTREELINYYKALSPYFQPGYSSMSDNNHYIFAKVEYLLAQECFQDDCSSQTRKEVLKTAVDKQKHKFAEYTAPSFTRRTGIFLIAVILVKEEDDSFVQSLSSNNELQKALLCLNHNMWMNDEEFNNLMIQYAETYLSNK